MDPASGKWKTEVEYETVESVFKDSDHFVIATSVEDCVKEKVSAGRWDAYYLAQSFEVSVVVPEHVAKLML